MKYIQCETCKNYTEVKTEYLTFCSHCNKKLSNSFIALNKKDPALNFNEYRNRYCTDETQLPIKKTKQKKRIIWPLLAFIVLFAGIIGYVANFFLSKKTSAVFETETKNTNFIPWERMEYGSFGLSLESPFKLYESHIEMAEKMKNHMVQADFYNGGRDDGLQINTRSILYSPGVMVLLEDAKIRLLEEYSSLTISNLKFEEKRIKNIGDFDALLLRGSFQYFETTIYFSNLILTHRNIVNLVSVVHTETDLETRKIVDRVIKSVEMN